MTKKMQGNILLLMTALIWGSAFMFQSMGTEYIDAFTFNTFRALITTISFGIIYLIMCLTKKKKAIDNELSLKGYLLVSLLAGISLFGACSLQQYGIKYTTVGKSGFLTSTQVVIVPILTIFLHKKVKLQVWISTIIALVGFYIMSITTSFIPSLGDSLTLAAALFFSIQVLICDYVSGRVDVIKYGMMFSFVFGVLSCISMFIFESPSMGAITDAIIPLLYVGILSGVAASSLQVVGQKHTSPTIATLILSLQSVFALIFGIIFLKEGITAKEAVGCLLVFIAVVISQIKFPKKDKKIET